MQMQSLDFPDVLKLNRLSYTSVILNHLMHRQDISMGQIGTSLFPLLSRCRSILPQYIGQYCDALNNITTQLDTYGDLAESCSRSGAYQARRVTCFEQLKTVIAMFEADLEMVDMLRNMHAPGTF